MFSWWAIASDSVFLDRRQISSFSHKDICMSFSLDLGSIVFVSRKWSPAVGGMETYCVRLIQELSKIHDLEVISLEGNHDGTVPGPLALARFGIYATFQLMLKKHRIAHIGDMAIWPLAFIAKCRSSTAKLFISAHGTDVSYARRGGVRGAVYGCYLRPEQSS